MKSLMLLIAIIPNIALANISLSPSISTYKAADRSSMLQVELRLGYEFDFGLFVGGFYSLASDKFVDHSYQYYMGPTVGYQYMGAYVLGSYLLVSEEDLASGGVKYSGISGFQTTIGYRLQITEDVFVGPEITVRRAKYKTREVQGIAGAGDREDNVILPSLAFYFKF